MLMMMIVQYSIVQYSMNDSNHDNDIERNDDGNRMMMDAELTERKLGVVKNGEGIELKMTFIVYRVIKFEQKRKKEVIITTNGNMQKLKKKRINL